MDKISYKQAGVDIEKADKFVEIIKQKIKSLPQSLMFGSFSSGVDLSGYKNPIVMLTTDGVGTKLKIAQAVKVHNTVGIDLVAMNVNDIITSGAKPIGFLDYIAIGKIDLDTLGSLIDGIVEGCKQSEMPLVGGETAEMPDFYPEGVYDLAGFCIGVCEKDELIDGKQIEKGDIIIGIPSSGFHSNGYSLIRKVLQIKNISYEDIINGREVYKILLEPTRIYWKEVKVVKDIVKIKGMAHITGGGIRGNLIRILPNNVQAVINKKSIPKMEVFKWIQNIGNIDEEEMYRTFNMGVGFIMVVSKMDADRVLSVCKDTFVCGEIVEGERNVILV